MRRISLLLSLLTVGLAACSSAHSEPSAAAVPAAAVAPSHPAAATTVAAAATAPQPDADKEQYVPAEFKAGASRWKDTGVYLDGRPIGFLTFGELPIALQPTWVPVKVDAEKRPGTNDLSWKWGKERYYKFTDYLRALGVDPRTVREMHVYGPKMAESIIVTGRDLSSPRAAKFMFRFGAIIGGKGIPQMPEHFGNGRTPDKIAAVMIYVKKKPPTLVHDDGFYLDGRPVEGVPYYGEPLRGGVRVYLDDKLATIIKRQDLDMKSVINTPDGPSWSLYDFLKGRGIDTSKIVEGWAIANERRTDRIAAADLATMAFTAGAQAKGVVTLGPKKITANVIALHTRALRADELPQILPEEE